MLYLDQANLESEFLKKSPFANWQEVEVRFASDIDIDTEISHSVPCQSPDHLSWIVINQSAPGEIYRAFGSVWGNGYIKLRSTTPSLNAVLLVFATRTATGKILDYSPAGTIPATFTRCSEVTELTTDTNADLHITGPEWDSSGDKALMRIGGVQHGIGNIYGTGLRIGTYKSGSTGTLGWNSADVIYINESTTYVGIGKSPSYEFDVSGQVQADYLELNHGAWDDLVVPAVAVNPTGIASAMTVVTDAAKWLGCLLAVNTGTPTCVFQWQLSHGQMLGRDVLPHIHWVKDDASDNSGTVVWEANFRHCPVNGAASAWSGFSAGTTELATGDTANYGGLTEWTLANSTYNFGISDIIVMVLRRNGGTSGDAIVLSGDIHFERVRLGSKYETSLVAPGSASSSPSSSPSNSPSISLSASPSVSPSRSPSISASASPSASPSPSLSPSTSPSSNPSESPSVSESSSPSPSPSGTLETTEALTSASTSPWVAPFGIANLIIECYGAGGYGAVAGDPTGGGGGGGGAYAKWTIASPSGSYNFQVGVGGAPESWFHLATDPLDSTHACLAKGGSNGSTGSEGGAGGAGGSSSDCWGDVKYSGGNGGDGQSVGGGGGGVASGSANGQDANGRTAGGTGGDGGILDGDGADGSANGGGGGGGGATSGSGGSPSEGKIVLTWENL